MLCYGCSSNEGKYRVEDDPDNKKIKVCKSFAKKIWKAESDEDLNKPSKRFDGCGLLSEDNGFSSVADEGLNYIIPSKKFNSFEEFIDALGIPYYEDYTIEIVDGDEETCFNFSSFIKPTFNFIVAALIYISFFIA